MIQPRSGNQGGGGGNGCYNGICGYCNKRGQCESECFKKKSDNERAHAAEEEEEDDDSEEHLMMAFEPHNYLSDNLDNEYIDFEAEQELFKMFNPRTRGTSPSTSAANPSTNPRQLQKKDDKYVPFKLFDEDENCNWIKFYNSDEEAGDVEVS